MTAIIGAVAAVLFLGSGLMKLGSEWDRAQGVIQMGAGVGLGIFCVLLWSAGVFQAAFGEALDALADIAGNTERLTAEQEAKQGR